MAMRQEQMEAEHTLKPELESAMANLEMAKTTRWAIQDKLATITHDRDLLLTRIEVLEQAVRMMQSQIEIQTAKNDLAADAIEAVMSEQVIPEGTERDRTKWIQCRGTGKAVPLFLRSKGWIRKINMSKMIAELRIKEIWSLKSLGDQKAHQQGKANVSLPDYFREYLKKRFAGVAQKMLAFAYNFVAALEKHYIDGDFSLFMKAHTVHTIITIIVTITIIVISISITIIIIVISISITTTITSLSLSPSPSPSPTLGALLGRARAALLRPDDANV
jgi:hypothetical protein